MSTLTPPASVAAQVAAARAAQRPWADLSVRARLRPVRVLRRLLAAEADALADALARDLGKNAAEALGGDVLPLADALLFLERQAERLLRPRRVPRGQRPLWLWGQADAVHRRPRGVVGVIGTWNYPLFLNGGQLAQALVAGNAAAWKPSEVAPSCAALLHRLVLRAGFPPDLVPLLPATRAAGAELAEADVDHIVFTGAAATGRRLAARLGERLVSSTLELSGCDSLFVLDDADVGLAARAAWFGALVNKGQTCIAARRAFVPRPLYGPFTDELRRLAAGVGPLRLALAAQAEQARRLVRAALADGGTLLVAPTEEALAADECRPAVVLDARPEMALCREASFAPVLAVLPCDGPDDALAMEAQCPYALGASIFTASRGRAEALAARLRAGVVTVNDVVVPTAHPGTPFGGRGASGWGSTQGAEGLLEMTVPQVLSARGGRFRPHYDMHDPEKAVKQADLLRAMLDAGHGATLGGRLRGWWRLVKALWRGV